MDIRNLLNEMSVDDLKKLVSLAENLIEKKEEEARELERIRREEEERERLRREEEERQRQKDREIEELRRRLSELEGSAPAFTPRQPVPQQVPDTVFCPYCHAELPGDSAFCSSCGRSLKAAPAEPSGPVFTPRQSPKTASPPVQQPVPQPIQQPAPQPVQQPVGGAQVRYAPESLQDWETLPGENTVLRLHTTQLLQPNDFPKNYFYLRITDKRILLSTESAMKAGLLGAGVYQRKGKPWLEIPLEAVKSYGLAQDYGTGCMDIEADRRYVLRDMSAHTTLTKLLPDRKR